MADAAFQITDWRVRDGVIDDAPEHHWPVRCSDALTDYGGVSLLVDRDRGASVAPAGKVEVYVEREGDALTVRIYTYDALGVPDDEPRASIRIAGDNSIS